MPWYAQSGPRRSGTGKFRTHSQMGPEKSASGVYRDWSYTFVAHQTGSSVRRMRYAVSICDPQQCRVKYLRDFSNLEQATLAAKECIDQLLEARLTRQVPGNVGTIPPLSLREQLSLHEVADRIAEQP